jgi:hypothetical protein
MRPKLLTSLDGIVHFTFNAFKCTIFFIIRFYLSYFRKLYTGMTLSLVFFFRNTGIEQSSSSNYRKRKKINGVCLFTISTWWKWTNEMHVIEQVHSCKIFMLYFFFQFRIRCYLREHKGFLKAHTSLIRLSLDIPVHITIKERYEICTYCSFICSWNGHSVYNQMVTRISLYVSVF